ncbi:MAG: N-acetyltransferase [Solirubrobacteraceae bacterium]|nr:N-acetyltransferase [Solirubrobacteraceae bacterium]
MWENLSTQLKGRLVVLEPLAPEHLDDLYEAAQPSEIWDWWPLNPAVDRLTFTRWFGGVLEAMAYGREAHFATIDAETGRPLGSTSYCTLRPDDRGLEIGWTWLTPPAWGTGVNAEAKYLQLRHAFEDLGSQRVEFETDELNARSRRALESLPAVYEGIRRDCTLMPDGRRRSSAIYSILDSEWPDVRANLERRVQAHVGRAS